MKPLAFLACAWLAAISSTLTAAEPATKTEERPVTFSRISPGDYQNFLVNWDDKKFPVLAAVIQTPAEYDALFHPAPVMGKTKPFAPKPEVFTNAQIVVAARVMTAPDDMDKVFTVDKVVETGGNLEIHYRFAAPKSAATYSVKNFLALQIPKRDYAKITFTENGKNVVELKPASGVRTVPAPKSPK